VPRLALQRAGQNSQVCPRCRVMACRALALPYGGELGCRRAERNVSLSIDRWKGFLPAPSDRASTLGEIR
jgi:hypothetical protein